VYIRGGVIKVRYAHDNNFDAVYAQDRVKEVTQVNDGHYIDICAHNNAIRPYMYTAANAL
jgi:hypothetical protein